MGSGQYNLVSRARAGSWSFGPLVAPKRTHHLATLRKSSGHDRHGGGGESVLEKVEGKVNVPSTKEL